MAESENVNQGRSRNDRGDNRSRLSASSLRKIFSKKQFSSVSSRLKKKSQTTFDFLPKQLHSISRQNENDSMTELFRSNSREIIFRGEILFIDSSLIESSEDIHYKMGLLLSTGELLIYDTETDSSLTLILCAAINLKDSSVTIENQTIIIKTNTDVLIRVQDNTQIQQWHDKLSMFCSVNETKEISPPSRPGNGNKRSLSFDSVSSKMKAHMRSIRKKCNIPESIKSITSNSWYTEDNFLSKVGQNGSQFDALTDANVIINENFFIISRVWAKITKPGDDPSMNVFVKMLVTLNKDHLYIRSNKKQLKIDMNKFELELVEYVKWSVRISCIDAIVDIKLNSKENYEKWSLAFLKLFKRNKENLKEENLPRTSYQNELSSCAFEEEDTQISRFPFDSFADSDDILRKPYNINMMNRRSAFGDDLITNRIPHKRISDISVSSVSKINRNSELCNYCSVTNHVHDLDDSIIPLPVRCEKKGFVQKFKKSCQLFTNLVSKSDENKKGEISSSNRTKSEIDLSIKSPRLFTKITTAKNRNLFQYSEDVNRITKSYNDLHMATSRSQEETKLQLELVQKIAKKQHQSYHEDENIYEEPVSSKNKFISMGI